MPNPSRHSCLSGAAKHLQNKCVSTLQVHCPITTSVSGKSSVSTHDSMAVHAAFQGNIDFCSQLVLAAIEGCIAYTGVDAGLPLDAPSNSPDPAGFRRVDGLVVVRQGHCPALAAGLPPAQDCPGVPRPAHAQPPPLPTSAQCKKNLICHVCSCNRSARLQAYYADCSLPVRGGSDSLVREV